MIAFVQWIPPVAYGLVASLYLLWFLGDRGSKETGALLRLVLGAIVLHVLALAVQGFARGRIPFASMGEALSVSALFLVASYALLEWKLRTTSLGVFFLGPVFVATVFSSTGAVSAPWPAHLRSPLFAIHACAGSAALAILFASSLLGGAYLLQYRQLENRRFGVLSRRLPALPALERAFRLCGSFGTALLALSVASGALWIVLWSLPLANVVTKIVFVCSTMAWFSVATLLGCRRAFTSRTSARLAMLGGILVVLVALVGAHG